MQAWGRFVRRVVTGFWATLTFAALVGIVTIVAVVIVATLNSDYDAATVQTHSIGSKSDSAVDVVIRISSVNDQPNTAQVTVVAKAGRSALEKYLRSDTDKLTFQVLDGLPDSGVERIASVTLDRSSIQDSMAIAESRQSTGALVMYHDPKPYPFDDYVTFLEVLPPAADRNAPDFRVTVVKLIAGRTMTVSADPSSFTITMKRPRIYQVFVVVGAGIFMAVIIGVAAHLFRSSAWDKPVNQAIAIAGLFLAAAGFRDILGLSKLASFSAMEAFIIGVPLLLLAIALLRGALMSLRRPTPPKAPSASFVLQVGPDVRDAAAAEPSRPVEAPGDRQPG
jgi:hypothetical protein